MFKNKSIQVKVVKDDKSEPIVEPRMTPTDISRMARETGKDVVLGAAILIGAYVVADTLRQVTVKIVEAKL
jgi:hypothetical protein